MLYYFTTNIYSQILYMVSMFLFGCYKNVDTEIDILRYLPFVACLLLFTVGVYFEFKIKHDYSPVTKKLFGNKTFLSKPVYLLLRITCFILFTCLLFIDMRYMTFVTYMIIYSLLHSLELLNDRIKKNKIYEALETNEK